MAIPECDPIFRTAQKQGGIILGAIFPKQADNTYRGQIAAIWIMVLVVLAKCAMAANSVFNTSYVASAADGIPLDRYTGGGAEAVIALFALLGLCQLVLALIAVLALIRYRSLLPLFYLIFLAEQLSRKWLIALHPIVRNGEQSVGLTVNLVLLGLLALGFVLSLVKRRRAA